MQRGDSIALRSVAAIGAVACTAGSVAVAATAMTSRSILHVRLSAECGRRVTGCDAVPQPLQVHVGPPPSQAAARAASPGAGLGRKCSQWCRLW